MAGSRCQRFDKVRFLILLAAAMFAATSASAADVVGKWYGKLDSEPFITIDKSGPAYSASLDYPDITATPGGMRDWPQPIHREIVSFEVAGNTVNFSIRNLISRGGDTNYLRDDYKLTLSEDGGELIGSKTSTFVHDSPDVRATVTPVTLFLTDFATRSQR
jgi:hypothetical protein